MDFTIPAPEGTPEDQKQTVNLLLSLPEDLQNNESLNQYKTFEDMARGLVETKRMVGDRVKVPGEGATPEDWDKFFTRLGRPETADGYEFTKVELPEAMGFDPADLNSFKEVFHKLGLTKTQADAIQKQYLEQLKAKHDTILSEYDKSVNTQLEALKTRWGADFEANRDLAMNTFNTYANPNLKATVEKEGWGNHPDFVELFHKIGTATKEDVLRNPQSGQVSKTAQDRIKEIEADPAFYDKSNPKRKDLLAERSKLFEELYKE